jgi:L-ascorbate metabolism protein UlaG (beta-lactamase superfamily)
VRRVLLASFLLLAFASLARAEDEKDVTVRWYGQACFELRFPTGLVVLCDPFDAKIGYVFPKDVKPDLVTISHEHFDHSNDKEVSGSPEVLRGLTSADQKTQEWKKHDLVKKGVHVRTVGVFHDQKEGAERGKDAIFVFEAEKKGAFGTIAHLGDLGHVLNDEQVKAIGPIDALLIPVGGLATIDAPMAKKVCDQLKPRVLIVPMHYKTPALEVKIPLADAEPFLKLFEGKVKREDGNETKVRGDEKAELEVVVLGYTGKENPVKEGSSSLSLKDERAWVDAQPGKDAQLHLTAEVTAAGGAKGGTLTVEATLDGKKLDVEDDATSEGQPKGGWKLEPNKKRVLKLALKEGQKGKKGGTLELEVKLDAGSGVQKKSASIPVQEVQ